jgi:hypothetical protein
VRERRAVELMMIRKAKGRARTSGWGPGKAAPGRGCEAADGDTSSASTPGRRDGGEVRQGGTGN